MRTFTYELINADHLSDEQVEFIESALESRSFVCQQEFEQTLDLGHQINVLAEAEDEAFVSSIEIENDEIYVELDCSKVAF